jgi:hypothetical protein
MDATHVEAAIRAGCTAADVHLACTYPACSCKQVPDAVRAALASARPPHPGLWFHEADGTVRVARASDL